MPLPQSKILKIYDHLIFLIVFLWGLLFHPKILNRSRRKTGKILFFSAPKTANEKFLWRKLIDHDPRFTELSDKLLSKKWINQYFSSLATPKVLWVGDKIDQNTIDRFKSSMCYLKANHSCGTNLKIPEQFTSLKNTEKICDDWMKKAHWLRHYEWGYRDIKKKLFIELDIRANNDSFSEIKVYTFNNNIVRLVHIIEIKNQKFANAWEFNEYNDLIRSTIDAEIAPPLDNFELPKGINDILNLSKDIGSNFDLVRIDFFHDGDKYWFGELTFYNTGGFFPDIYGNDKKSILSSSWDILHSHFFIRDDLNVFLKIYRNSLKRHLT